MLTIASSNSNRLSRVMLSSRCQQNLPHGLRACETRGRCITLSAGFSGCALFSNLVSISARVTADFSSTIDNVRQSFSFRKGGNYLLVFNGIPQAREKRSYKSRRDLHDMGLVPCLSNWLMICARCLSIRFIIWTRRLRLLRKSSHDKRLRI